MLKDDSNGTGTLGSCDVLQPVSDMERKLDRKTRLQILLQLFQLACAMVSKHVCLCICKASLFHIPCIIDILRTQLYLC